MTGIPIADQADEVEREIRQRERLYPKWIENGRLRQDTAQKKIATLKAAAATLRFVALHAAGLRALAHFLIASAPGTPPEPSDEERAALLAHPAVSGLLAVWPEAEVRILPPASADAADLFTSEEREDA